jgi:exopolysaccharide production protein ExoQ
MLKTLEKLFAMAMLAYGCGAFALLLIGQWSDTQKMAPEMHTSGLVAQIGFHVIAAFFYLVHAKKVTRAIVRTPWWIPLVLFAVCSTAWSQDPVLTFRRGLILVGTFLFGLYFGSRFELREQIDILAWMFLLVLVASAALAIAAPQMGVESGGGHLGQWRGVLSQKNTLARVCVLAILVFSFWRPSYRPLRYFAIVFGLAVLGMTRSATGLVVLIALLIVKPVLRLIRTQGKLLIPVAMLAVTASAAAIAVLLTNSDLALTLLGRDSTLTGRTQLWQQCMVSIMKRPFLGYGFDAFWRGMTGESARVILASHWLVPTAHNGALQLWLDLGAIGLALFILPCAIYTHKSFAFYVRDASYLRAWPLAYLAFVLFYNFTEVTELEQNNIFTMLLVALAATVTLQAFGPETYDHEYLPTAAFEAEPIYIS